MCLSNVVSAVTGAIGGLLGMNSGGSQTVVQQAAQDPVAPPPQAAKSPDTTAIQQQASTPGSGVNSGPASTLLTGSSGVDPNSLNIGKNTLLGANTLLGS